MRDDLLKRVHACGIETLLVTVDLPVNSRRERQVAAALAVTPRMTPMTLWHVAERPAWAFATLRHVTPRFWTMEPYVSVRHMREAAHMIGSTVDVRPDWRTIA